MSKKHFIALADVLRAQGGWSQSQLSALADFCEEQNADFKRDRWLAYVNGECGPNGGKI